MSKLFDIARNAGLSPYEWSGSYCGSLGAVAERLTSGKTYYYSANTRKYHGASVSRLRVIADGMALAAIERVSLDYNHSRKGYRVVVHDLAGTVINERADLEHSHKTLRAANKEFDAVCAELDNGRVILKRAMEEEHKRLTRELSNLQRGMDQLAQDARGE